MTNSAMSIKLFTDVLIDNGFIPIVEPLINEYGDDIKISVLNTTDFNNPLLLTILIKESAYLNVDIC